MSGSLNRVMIIGNLGRDPEIKSSQTGSRFASLSVATSESWRDKRSGEKHEKVEWHRVVVFNEHLVGIVEKYLRKGAKVYVEGALKTRKWTDNAGTERYSTEVVLQNYGGQIVMLGGGEDDEPATDSALRAPRERTASQELDDEIQF